MLLANYKGYQRLAQLKYVPLAGGDISVLRPYRMALAHLWAAGMTWDADLPPVAACPTDEQRVLRHQLETGWAACRHPAWAGCSTRCPHSPASGKSVAYEAQAAIELEGLARGVDGGTSAYAFDIDRSRNPALIDPAPVLAAVIRDQRAGVPAAVIGARFHCAVADLVVDLACDRQGCIADRRAVGRRVPERAAASPDIESDCRPTGFMSSHIDVCRRTTAASHWVNC